MPVPLLSVPGMKQQQQQQQPNPFLQVSATPSCKCTCWSQCHWNMHIPTGAYSHLLSTLDLSGPLWTALDSLSAL